MCRYPEAGRRRRRTGRRRPAGCTLTTSATVRLWIAIAGLSAVAVGLLLSPFRHARAADMALGSA